MRQKKKKKLKRKMLKGYRFNYTANKKQLIELY